MTYDDVFHDCKETPDNVLDMLGSFTFLELPEEIEDQSAQKEAVGLYYVAIAQLIAMLEARQEVAKEFLKAHIPNDSRLSLGGYEINNSKPTLQVDKEAWEHLVATDPEVLSAVTQHKHWSKQVKQFKDLVSEATGSKITWKVQ